jgi:adenylate cyclase
VLPFQNMSGDPEQEYFADGMVEDITTALSRFRQLFVIARNSSFTYRGKAVDVKQVGRELGVRYVLEGSVRRAGDKVRIAGQLIEAATNRHVWADRFEGTLEDIFGLQDRVTESVVGQLVPRLEQAEIERARHKPTENLDAYDCFLRGKARYDDDVDQVERVEASLPLFTQAIELDTEFAPAYAMAAMCYLMRKASGRRNDPKRETAEALTLARRAVELGKDDAFAQAVLGVILTVMVRDLNAGVALMERALTLNPNLAMAWLWGGWLKIWLGEPDAAVGAFERAARLNPIDRYNAGIQNGLAHAHFHACRYDEASSCAVAVLSADPNFHDGLRISAASDALAGRFEQARETIERLLRFDPTLRCLI